MFIYAHRAMVFSLDPKMEDRTKMVQVIPKAAPQEVPDWIATTETYKLALQAKYIEEVTVPADQADAVAALSRKLAPTHIGPLAAETRRLADFHPGSGLGKLSQF